MGKSIERRIDFAEIHDKFSEGMGEVPTNVPGMREVEALAFKEPLKDREIKESTNHVVAIAKWGNTVRVFMADHPALLVAVGTIAVAGIATGVIFSREDFIGKIKMRAEEFKKANERKGQEKGSRVRK